MHNSCCANQWVVYRIHKLSDVSTQHLKKLIELADAQIAVSKSLQDLDLGIEIKKKTLRKLYLEIKKLEKYVTSIHT